MKTLKTGNPILDSILSKPVKEKNLDTVNKRVLSKIYSDEEILELIELDKILNFDRTTFLFDLCWDNDIFPEPHQLLITDAQAWKRAQQLLGKEELNRFYVKSYDQRKLNKLLKKAQKGDKLSLQAWREVMAYDLFKRMARVYLFLDGRDSNDYKK